MPQPGAHNKKGTQFSNDSSRTQRLMVYRRQCVAAFSNGLADSDLPCSQVCLALPVKCLTSNRLIHVTTIPGGSETECVYAACKPNAACQPNAACSVHALVGSSAGGNMLFINAAGTACPAGCATNLLLLLAVTASQKVTKLQQSD